MATVGGAVPVKRALSLVVIVALAAAVAPSLACAHGPRAGSTRIRAGAPVHKGFSVPQKSVFPQPVDPWKFWGAPKHHHGHHHGGFAPFLGTSGFIGGSSVIVTAPALPVVVETSPVVYAPPPMWAPAAPVALPAPATLPMPTLVDHPSGWYQLRGDGATTPYTWVWIPKPPASPASSSEPAPLADSNVRDRRGEAYHWTDDRGVTTWTNRLEKVPKRFRDQAAATAQPD